MGPIDKMVVTHRIRGIMGLGVDGVTVMALVVMFDGTANNYEIWRVQRGGMPELRQDIDSWHEAGVGVREAGFSHRYADTSKYSEEFMTEPAALKFVEREAKSFTESHGLFKMAGFGYDAALVAADAGIGELQRAVGHHMQSPHRERKSRFDDDDDSFGSRFGRASRRETFAPPTEVATPVSDEAAARVANDDAMPAPVRLENPVSKKGGKFWEASVVRDTDRIDAPGREWHVILRWGAIADDKMGSACNVRRVASFRTKGLAAAEMRERIRKQLNKRYPDGGYYRQVA